MSTSQARLSQYFSSQSSSSPRKRGIDVIDLTDDDPSSKKPKRDVNPKTTQWRFDPQAAIDQVDSSGSESKKARHEAFKKKLLLENNSLFLNKPSATRDSDLVEDEQASDSESDRELQKPNEKFSYSSEKRRNPATTTARRADIGPSGKSYTPLEKQILRLKEENPGTVLMVEVGYKYKFFGEDAKVAATELGVACYPERNFLVAFIPCERRHIHLKNLLSRGHRVGIVNQIETAALKKISDNRNAVFERKLTHLFTAATFVDELDSIDDGQSVNPPTFLCIVENTKSSANEKDVNIALISISPSTGDVVWDDFSDTTTRLELQARLAHLKPSEILSLCGGLTKPTERMLRHVVQSSTETGKVRSETFSTLMSYTDAFSFISNYYTSKASNRSGELMAMVSGFSRRVVIAIAHTIKYLSTYNLADALATKFFSKFTSQSHMVLTANTLNNLEIFQNTTDGSTHGTLFSLLNLTQTKFGARLLRRWVAQPLIDKDTLQERVDAVEEIISSSSEILVTLRQILRKLPDLARGLCRIQYNQCIPKELAVLFSAFEKIAKPFEPFNEISHVGFRSRLLNEIIFALPTLRPAVKEIIGAIHTAEALKGNKIGLWTDSDKYPKIEETAMALQAVEVDLLEKLKSIRKELKMPSLDWKTWNNEEYLIEIKRSQERLIPDDWILFNRTAYYARYRPPNVTRMLEERAQLQEMLDVEANLAYRSFLDEISDKHYGILRNVVDKLAMADSLMSLGQLALQHSPGYVRPILSTNNELEIIDGRHPIIEVLRSDPFIPNTICMGTHGEARNKIITGPNMGGKSSVVRMVALIAIMAQIGCYVPASSVKLGILDSILTRMGASDDLARGRSTFMVEMTETKEIIDSASSKSLVILDELGRGTSTFDGMAIASAVLHHLVQSTICKTLFITHYPSVAEAFGKHFIADVQNLHMGYLADSRINGVREITFLYRLAPGIAKESFGIECGRLAGLPEELLLNASRKASEMQELVNKRIARNRTRKVMKILAQGLSSSESSIIIQLWDMIKSMNVNP